MRRANASLLIGTSSWKEQFIEATTVSSSDEEDEKQPTALDYIMHCLTLFWKILFAFVPPTGKICLSIIKCTSVKGSLMMFIFPC